MAENVKLEKEELEKLQIATDSLNKFKLKYTKYMKILVDLLTTKRL